ncbi:MAG: hypothetical protein M1835_001198, partial [Candelina submexicana]
GELGSVQYPNDAVYDNTDELSESASLTSGTTNPRGSSTLLTGPLGGSRLSLVVESTTPPSHDPKAQASIDGLRASNSTSSSQDQGELESTVTPPLRKRSFFTPGIATRVKSRNTLRKAPPPDQLRSQADKDYYYNPQFPEISPLSQLADLGASEPRGPHYSRTAIPSEPTYSHLAGLRQGTLRITNGAASPVLSVRTEHLEQVAPDVEREEEFLTASEGRSSAEIESGLMLKELGHQKGCHAGQSAAVDYANGDCRRNLHLATVPCDDETPRCGSPRRSESWTQNIGTDDSDDEPADTKGKVLMKRRSLSLFEFPAWSNDRASSMAERYMQELPHRPFSRGGPTDTPSTEVVEPSDRRLRDDEGIVIAPCRDLCVGDSDTSPSTAMKSGAGAREEALSILEGTATSRPQSEIRPDVVSRYSWAAASNVANRGIDDRHASKADSGYSSKESLDSLQNESQAVHEIDTRATALPQMAHSTTGATGSQPPMPQRLAPAVPLQSLANATVVIPGQASKFSASPKLTKSHMGAAIQIPSETMTTLAVKETSPSRSPRKLQKPRRLSQSMLESANITVQACKEIQSSQIPLVPSDVAAKHAERLSKFPTLGHTFPSLDHTSSEESLSAAALLDVPIRFPSPSDGGSASDDERTGRSREQIDKCSSRQPQPVEQVPQTKSFRARSKSRQKSASRHRSGSQATQTPSIADFGTVTESLGPSPYDIAASTVQAPPNDAAEQSSTSLHQESNDSPQAKTMVGMDEEAATVFAKERSQSRNRSKVKNFSRPRSIHNESFDDREGFPGKIPRPTSLIIFDAPPVPSLPAIEQVKQTAGPDGQTTRPQKLPRPSSMILDVPVGDPQHREARKLTVGEWQKSSHRPLISHTQSQSAIPRTEKFTAIKSTERVVPVEHPRTQTKGPMLGSRSNTLAAPEQRNKRLPEPPRLSDAEALEVSQDWETAKRAWQQRRKSLAKGLQPGAQIATSSQNIEPAPRSPTKTRYYASVATVPAKEDPTRTKSSDVLAVRPHPQSTNLSPTVVTSIERPGQNPTYSYEYSKPAQKEVLRSEAADVRLRPESVPPAQRHIPRAESLSHMPYSGSDTLKPAREDVPRTKSADVARPRRRPQSTRPAPRAIPRTESLTDISYRGHDISEPARDYVPRARSFEPPRTKSPAEGLLNRYGGGLAFDYEPGFGLGGSAGQRNVKSKASRKSIDVSMSYGVDLSDIPVFVNF